MTFIPPPPKSIYAEPTDEVLFDNQTPPEPHTMFKEFERYVTSWAQYHFVTSPAKFPAMVAGYGSGKTHAAVLRALILKCKYPDQNIGYYLPTYDLIEQIAFPRFEEFLVRHGFVYKLNEKKKEIRILGASKIIFRTMDRPERIIGYEHADALTDELDTLKIDKAADVWRKIVARNRQKKPDGSQNTIGVATTPEGFRFVYERWKRKPMIGSQIIKASTYSNQANLPADYIDTLRDVYPDQMLEAYINGEFVNLTQGCVYPEFDRVANSCDTTVNDNETLHIGVDFNVGHMGAIVHVLRDGEPHAVDEFVDYLDTPALITAIRSRYPSRSIMCYPDASGKSRKSVNAASSDIALLGQARFTVLAKKTNPFVKDRVASMNKVIHKDGERVYRVNVDTCPHLVEGLEKQAYNKNGEPDKTSGIDHVIDATGYFISYRFPIVHGKARTTNLTGI